MKFNFNLIKNAAARQKRRGREDQFSPRGNETTDKANGKIGDFEKTILQKKYPQYGIPHLDEEVKGDSFDGTRKNDTKTKTHLCKIHRMDTTTTKRSCCSSTYIWF